MLLKYYNELLRSIISNNFNNKQLYGNGKKEKRKESRTSTLVNLSREQLVT
jgi:hypothetical protein